MAIIINLTVGGQEFSVDITNNLAKMGELMINEIKREIRKARLIQEGGGDYLQKWVSQVDKDGLLVESLVPYSAYLEYGTFAWFDRFGLEKFPANAPKKKDLPASLRKALPKGMAPFAPVRRVLFNQKTMNKIVKKAFAPGI